MEDTPDMMAGSARRLSDEECEAMDLPQGTHTFLYVRIYMLTTKQTRARTDSKKPCVVERLWC